MMKELYLSHIRLNKIIEEYTPLLKDNRSIIKSAEEFLLTIYLIHVVSIKHVSLTFGENINMFIKQIRMMGY